MFLRCIRCVALFVPSAIPQFNKSSSFSFSLSFSRSLARSSNLTRTTRKGRKLEMQTLQAADDTSREIDVSRILVPPLRPNFTCQDSKRRRSIASASRK